MKKEDATPASDKNNQQKCSTTAIVSLGRTWLEEASTYKNMIKDACIP